ncbi:MAG: YtxH domain-containing protein [Candidatus Acidiferrales bacterium]|jgi:gas vesicle protein
MTEKIHSTAGYFLAGLAIGSLVGIVFAPKSGEGTRGFLSKKVKHGSKHARKKARELRERAEDLVDRGTELVNQANEQIATGLDEATTADMPVKAKARAKGV